MINIRKAQVGMPIAPMFSEADAGFPGGQEQLIENNKRREFKKQMASVLKQLSLRNSTFEGNDGRRYPKYGEEFVPPQESPFEFFLNLFRSTPQPKTQFKTYKGKAR